ncbi:hypothetical protein KY285_026148 [Solanum tuberosum]|nr:hypothetical protein KY285_026148 [Solanum tuberosum]
MKHDGKKTSLPRVRHNVTRNIFMLIQLRKPRMRCPPLWPEMLKELDAYRTKMKVTKVIWKFPPASWVKYNTDGASRGNPGLSSYAFCLRDDKGDIMYAEGKMIETATNTVAKAKAILEACTRREVDNSMDNYRYGGRNKDIPAKQETYFPAYTKGRKPTSRLSG